MSSVSRSYEYFDLLVAGFVTSLLVTGTVASKLFAPVVNFLKKAEGEDYYDIRTKFNPFALLRGTRAGGA